MYTVQEAKCICVGCMEWIVAVYVTCLIVFFFSRSLLIDFQRPFDSHFRAFRRAPIVVHTERVVFILRGKTFSALWRCVMANETARQMITPCLRVDDEPGGVSTVADKIVKKPSDLRTERERIPNYGAVDGTAAGRKFFVRPVQHDDLVFNSKYTVPAGVECKL